jgi:hypothetical protein
MFETFMGLNITRAIPTEVFAGLMTGDYSLHGGVIRWAAGTESAGQIVQHMIPIAQQGISASLFAPIAGILEGVNTYQLHNLTGQTTAIANQVNVIAGQVDALTTATQQVLNIANTTMIFSGLSLAVTSVGFVMLNKKLNNLEGKLNEIGKDVKAIRALLELDERSRLAAALRDLLNIADVKNVEHRDKLLFNSKNILGQISLKYKELLADANTLEMAMAYEEYFCLTSLAHARCLAELGMLDIARRDLEQANEFWKAQSQYIANEFLLGKNPERFLFSDFSQDVPVSVLIEWLDFAYGKEKGYAWIDELRNKIKPWYSKESQTLEKGLFDVFSSFTDTPKTKGLVRQKEKIIPSLQKLVARNKVLSGFIAQYELLEKHNITPTEFEQKIASLPETAKVNGYIILQPAN